jgi:Spy/CpxP family protein refolding chaperone
MRDEARQHPGGIMRQSRVFAVIVASLVSSAAVAQAQTATPRPHAERHEMREGRRGGHGMLRGLELSDVEKSKLKEINGKYASEGKSLRESLKPAMQEARADRAKGDTAAARAVLQRNKAGMEQVKALRDRRNADIRSALSPENQKRFDANLARATERRADGKRGGHKRDRDRANG